MRRRESTSKTYDQFISSKLKIHTPQGLSKFKLPAGLSDLQKALTPWALRRGKAAIFAGTGLGKTRIEVAFGDAVAKHTGKPVIMFTPLAVAAQVLQEGERVGVKVNYVREQSDVRQGINVTNYERMHKFDRHAFSGGIADESSCIKHSMSKTTQQLIHFFSDFDFRLPCTATPAPNDWTEFGTHAELLGVCSQQEMLSEFFVHDMGTEVTEWRLKGHAQDQFWRWLASWGAFIQKPSDLGFDDSAYILPKLQVHNHRVGGDIKPAEGTFFGVPARGLHERQIARKESFDERVSACIKRVNAEPDKSWVVWCELNSESAALTAKIKGSIEVIGALDVDEKERRIALFSSGGPKVLISKPSITGWGLNWQHCTRQAFVGITDSYESYFQAVRRSWRFGQKEEVHVHRFFSASESSVFANLNRKELNAEKMAKSLYAHVSASVLQSVFALETETNAYDNTKSVIVPSFL